MAKAKGREAVQVLDEVVPEGAPGGPPPPPDEAPLGRPSPTSPDWTPWVLAQLEDGEKWEGEDGRVLPYTKGLRRFARQFLQLEASEAVVHSVIPGDGPPTVTVVHHLRVEGPPPGIPSSVSAAATRGPFNVNGKAANFPGETADTVAEGRALTRLLGLNTITKDEMGAGKADELPAAVPVSATISSAQLRQLESICRRANVNPAGLPGAGKRKTFARVEEMSTEVFWKLAKYLDDVMKRRAAGGLTADDEQFLSKAGDFDPNWRAA